MAAKGGYPVLRAPCSMLQQGCSSSLTFTCDGRLKAGRLFFIFIVAPAIDFLLLLLYFLRQFYLCTRWLL